MSTLTKKSAEQMIKYLEDSENVERYAFLVHVLDDYLHSGIPDEQLIEVTKYHIEDDMDKNLNEDEISIMLIALKLGFTEGYRKGMGKALNKYKKED